jgi:uncharacterized protein (DUF169 family)
MDLIRFAKALETYVRTATPPVAVRLLESAGEIPERAKMPVRDFGVTMPLCQGMALARRHEMVVAMGADDMLCPLGAVATGLLPAKEGFLDGRFGIPYWVPDKESAARLLQGMARLDYGKYAYIVMAPLERTAFEPDVVVMYGNPAQIGRMIQTAVYVTGEPVLSQAMGGTSCAEQIARTILSGRCQSVLAGAGERMLALTQDHETSFTLSANMADAFAAALEATQKLGVRYPTRSWLKYGATMTPAFAKMSEYLRQED